jgi:hypothetical protein
VAAEKASLATALEHIKTRAKAASESEASFIVNRVVDVMPDGHCEDYPWPR